MADTAAAGGNESKRGGFGRGGRGRGDRRGGRGGSKPKSGADPMEEGEWIPVTRLGRLVKEGKIKSLEEVFKHAIPIKEYQIIDHFLGDTLKDQVMKIMPVQKQTAAGQRTRFKCFVVVGDTNGHIGLGVKTASEVATAIRGAIWSAKTSIVPVRRGYWGSKAGLPHTVPIKVTGKSGSVRFRIIPAPRGTGLVGAPTSKALMAMAGLEDAYTSTRGHSKTMGNFIKAIIDALGNTYSYLTPDLWEESKLDPSPFDIHSEFLSKGSKSTSSSSNQGRAARNF